MIWLRLSFSEDFDYCNSVLAGLPWSTVAPLQQVQNAAARLVLGLSPRDHVSWTFLELHYVWLPIHYRIQFKLALLMHMAHNNKSPAYISDVTCQSAVICRAVGYVLPTLPTLLYPEPGLSSGRERSVSGPTI